MGYHKTTPVFKKMVGRGHMVLDNLAHVNLMAKVTIFIWKIIYLRVYYYIKMPFTHSYIFGLSLFNSSKSTFEKFEK